MIILNFLHFKFSANISEAPNY